MKKSNFTIGMHQAAGKLLKENYYNILSLNTVLKNSYPADSNVVRLANNLLAGCLSLRVELDDLVCIENPKTPDLEVTSCYFGSDIRPEKSCPPSCDTCKKQEGFCKVRKKYDNTFVCPDEPESVHNS